MNVEKKFLSVCGGVKANGIWRKTKRQIMDIYISRIQNYSNGKNDEDVGLRKEDVSQKDE